MKMEKDTEKDLQQLKLLMQNTLKMDVAAAVFEVQNGVPRLKRFVLVNPNYPDYTGIADSGGTASNL